MTLTCTSSPGDAVVSNQHRDQDRRADAAFVAEAIQHLRTLGRMACGGWSSAPSEDGRYLVTSGQQDPEVIIETHGIYAQTLVPYLLAVDPWRMLGQLALLEDLQRGVATGEVAGTTRQLLVRYAEEILGRKRGPADTRRPAP